MIFFVSGATFTYPPTCSILILSSVSFLSFSCCPRLCAMHQYRHYPIRMQRQPGIVIMIWKDTLKCCTSICISCQQVTYTIFDGVPVKLYRPRGDDGGPLPGMVYYHGGGCCMGSAGTNTGSCVDNCMFLLRFVGPTVQYNTIQYNATQRNATQRNATQRNATQRNATQRNATQRNVILTPRGPQERGIIGMHLVGPYGGREL